MDLELSIGDYVLTGGELPFNGSYGFCYKTSRGVISKESLVSESFDYNLLDYPNYTKPLEYRGMKSTRSTFYGPTRTLKSLDIVKD